MHCLLAVVDVAVLAAVLLISASLVRRMRALETAVVSSVLEESAKPIKQEAKVRRNVYGILAVAGFPCVCLLSIGAAWGSLSTAMDVMLVVVAVIMSVAVFFITTLLAEWG